MYINRIEPLCPNFPLSRHDPFLANGCNVTQTAEALGTHRNTLLRRLERAQDLLPVRLADHRIQIAAALELVIWSTPLVDDDK
ncbi:helix-turn-helix domain-containing protein [Pseudomonas aeruginosa]|uniref:helix-turn-helix domain-containing protein n=1 Tax=Pseudomonas aeruginosa TaxID=287 RepID=UPI002B20B9DA|nr:helix-turn-helix domain-containing protein [Pseudomonas aeruginosa]